MMWGRLKPAMVLLHPPSPPLEVSVDSGDPLCSSPRTEGDGVGGTSLYHRGLKPIPHSWMLPHCLSPCCLRLQVPLRICGVQMKNYAPRQSEEKQNRNYVVLLSLHQCQYFTASSKQHSLLQKQLCRSPSYGPQFSPRVLTPVLAVCPSALFLRPTFHLPYLLKSEIVLELWVQPLAAFRYFLLSP